MSGAQGKAVDIANGVGIIAEVDASRIETRLDQGWVDQVADSPAEAFAAAGECQRTPRAAAPSPSTATWSTCSNTRWTSERPDRPALRPDLLPRRLRRRLLPPGAELRSSAPSCCAADHGRFRELVDAIAPAPLRRSSRPSSERGTYFFDYGNSFLKAVYDAGVREICRNGENPLDGFVFPSYVEDIMGPLLFDYGYGPFRWVCLSGRDEDLAQDRPGGHGVHRPGAPLPGPRQLQSGSATRKKNRLVVGTQARILYQDALGRMKIALQLQRDGARRARSGRSCSAATTTTPAAPIRPSGRRPTSTTAATSWPTWPPTASPATPRAA